MLSEIRKNVRFNFVVNVTDGGFFGMALGFASFVTVIPLFVNTLTDSKLLIGMIASIHLIGWQLPQILTASHVSRMRRFKPMVIRLTVHERWPFLGLALVALFSPTLGRDLTLALTFLLAGIQAFGGGFAATAWQSMVAKIIPPNQRGTFYGSQSAAANLLSSGAALAAGVILAASGGSSEGFAVNFLIAGVLMFVSFCFIAMTREPATEPKSEVSLQGAAFRQHLVAILRQDGNYRLFIVGRMLIQAASIGSAFYTIFAVRRFEMDAATAGVLTGVLLLSATVGNPLFGWLGDRWNRRVMFGIAGLLAGASAILALLATSANWFFPVFVLFGLSNGGVWTVANAMIVDFGAEKDRPYYIGLANTLVAPATLFAPMLGGWLADAVGFEATFMAAAAAGILTAVVVLILMRDPMRYAEPSPRETAPASSGAL
ncbi:MAG: MFS transporter [Anaerolineae bacterium]|nr:MFS transporter [Anaerolineae bacterium]NUQ03303.1 MFS transporter [Anaerolineae bacterium]